jgi:hypothetical protein
MLIADIAFERWAYGVDLWISTDKRMLLQLVLDGRWWRSKFSTPYVAIVRVKERIDYDEARTAL